MLRIPRNNFLLFNYFTSFQRSIRLTVYELLSIIELMSFFPWRMSFINHNLSYQNFFEIYILAGDKKGDTYEYILNVIKFYFDLHCPGDIGTILVDFEKTVMNAFLKSLPGWEVSNCYFHLGQAVQKNIQ